ncbi:unnamed protein product [Notodromas monacha]|uniref:Uncharacterized protein n=1 Tax=Notodromas monacha TaxID=399045 RepID=A0A7R9GKP4_9CRUS|nr:unnamed protein product [Notodromas monacha]CAG0925003.1 unnamed protein product [Notodromas monacha]
MAVLALSWLFVSAVIGAEATRDQRNEHKIVFQSTMTDCLKRDVNAACLQPRQCSQLWQISYESIQGRGSGERQQ